MKLEDQLRGEIRKLHYSIRTEEAYVLWYRQFVRFHGLMRPSTGVAGGAAVSTPIDSMVWPFRLGKRHRGVTA